MPALALSRVGTLVVESVDSGTEGADQRLVEEAWARLEQIPDPRSVHGRVYSLSCLLAIAVCAFTAAGNDGLTAIGQWIAKAGQQDLARMRAPYDPLTRTYRAPDEKTIRVVLDRIEPRQLTRALLGPRSRTRKAPDGSPSRSVRVYRERREKRKVLAENRSGLRAVAVDGKSSRGARRADGTRVHLLGVCEHAGRFLDQIEVDVKHNEVTHFQELLERLDLEGKVVTFDALHTVRANLEWLVSTKKAHYIAVVKKNQPLLLQRLKALPWKQIPTANRTRETGHGRIDTRTVKAAHVEGLDLPHARQAVKLTRWRQNTKTGKISHESIYIVTSLTSAEATPADLARLIREHWSVEMKHYVRDVSFREDHCTNRTGHGPINLATIREAVSNSIHDAGYLYLPEGRRDHTTPIDALYLHGLT
jgi:predicted transposase YbfD/YdcC